MRHLLDLLNETTVLTESRRDYEAMINPILDALIKPQTTDDRLSVDVNGAIREKIIKRWAEIVAAAMKTLKKADRVTWFLRAMRVALTRSYAKHLDPVRTDKLVRDFEARTGTSFDQDHFPLMDALPELEHFLSLPIPEITNYQFRFQSWTEIHSEFIAAEDRWKKTVESSFVDDDCKTIIDFKNGWFWVNTEKSYCSKESQAMGHCGNSPREHTDDRLLSLRKKIMVGEQTRWEPHLTFILTNDGFLTEMKGRNNDKPVEKYHKMIVALLENPIVTGIRGGGYLPENNFAMSDLDDATRNRLIDDKPGLGTLWDIYKTDGLTEEVYGQVCDALHDMGLPKPIDFNAETAEITIYEDSLYRFCAHELNDEALGRVASLANGDRDEIEWLDTTPEKGLRIIAEKEEEDPDVEHDIVGLVASLIHLDKKEAIDGLLYTFPKSLPSIWDEIWKQVHQSGINKISEFINETRFEYSALQIMVTRDMKLLAWIKADSLINDITALLTNDGYIEDENNLEGARQAGTWFREAYADEWSDEPTRELTLEDFESEAFEALGDHIRGLFDTSDQLSFDFS